MLLTLSRKVLYNLLLAFCLFCFLKSHLGLTEHPFLAAILGSSRLGTAYCYWLVDFSALSFTLVKISFNKQIGLRIFRKYTDTQINV